MASEYSGDSGLYLPDVEHSYFRRIDWSASVAKRGKGGIGCQIRTRRAVLIIASSAIRDLIRGTVWRHAQPQVSLCQRSLEGDASH